MDPETNRHERIKALFLQALETPAGRRAAALESACAGDPKLLREVFELLSFHGARGDLLDPATSSGTLPDPLVLEAIPDRLGRYRIEGLLGWGGMGVVYLARADGESEPVALKVLRDAQGGVEMRKRLEREARILQTLDHPRIAGFRDSGVLERNGHPLPFVATEYVRGLTLREHVRDIAPDLHGKLRLLAEIGETLAYAHARGVVHRDLKPENILVTPEGHPTILDFGISRLTESPAASGGSAMTRVDQILGTAHYMSPEQARASGDPIDGRSDIYSLGVIGFELLSGRLPYGKPTDSLHQTVVSILTMEPPPLSAHEPSLRGPVERIIGVALRKNPAERYASADQFAADIRSHLRGRTISRQARQWRPQPSARSRQLRWAGALGLGGALLSVWFLRPATIAAPDYRQIYSLLQHANDLIHGSPPTRASLLQSIDVLDRARTSLFQEPDGPGEELVERFIDWRSGEAHYFLGHLDHDPLAFQVALVHFERASHRMPPWTLSALDSTRSIFGDIARLGRHHTWAGVGLAHAALAEYETPLVHHRYALENRRTALRLHDSDLDNYAPRRGPSAESRQFDRMVLLNDIGGSLLGVGVTSQDADTVDAALAVLGQASSGWPLPTVRPAYGSYLMNRARAHRWRAILRGSPADLDSALALLQRAQDIRTFGESPTGFASVHRERARVALAAAEILPDARDRHRWFDRALPDLVLAEDALEAAQDSLAVSLLAVERAELLGRLAELEPGRALAPADSLLAFAANTLTLERFPLRHVDVLRVQALLDRVRWKRTGDEASRKAAIETLRRALAMSSEEDDRWTHRRLREELEELGPVGS